ncbi:hypothetical protein BBJ28_00013943, partial [Nothophytophthora sp. Chile5]
RTGTPKYDQSWLVGVESLDTFIEVNVYHKRKPLPKKRLGFVRFSMEDIYRDFESIPAKILSDTNAKMQLKRRKRVRGSIISKLATTSEHPVEVRDDSWRLRIARPPKSGSSILSEDEAEGFEDYDQELSALSSHSICMDGTYPPSPVGIPLQECESGATIYLSIRYVNDMRRYALPYIRTASEIQEMKFWRASVSESDRIIDPVKNAKNQTSRLINMQLGKLSSITRQASLDFPALKRMHPLTLRLMQEVVVLTLGKGVYEKHIQMLRRVYASLHNVGKRHERECQSLRTKQEAIDCGLRCIEVRRKRYLRHILSIGFVFDPTGQSGTSTEDQLFLRDELRHRVGAARPDHKWLDIISKIDQPANDLASLERRCDDPPSPIPLYRLAPVCVVVVVVDLY